MKGRDTAKDEDTKVDTTKNEDAKVENKVITADADADATEDRSYNDGSTYKGKYSSVMCRYYKR